MLNTLFDINAVFITIFSYPISYVEFIGTIFTGLSVYLTAKNKIISWPLGIIGVIFYLFLFFQIRLYSDFFEQIFYLITGFWGWYLWANPKRQAEKDKTNELKISTNSSRSNLVWILGIAFLTLVVGYFMARIHLIWPNLFPEAAAYPYLDGLTTVMSFAANIFLMRRKIENWYIWLVVDVIGVGLYASKGVIFLSLLYFYFLINAVKGYREWRKILKNYD